MKRESGDAPQDKSKLTEANNMQEKNFISYEYSTKTVKAKDQTKAIDMYEHKE